MATVEDPIARYDDPSDEPVDGGAPLRVRRVKIVGNKRTKAYVVEEELQDAYKADTVEAVYHGLVRGAEQLSGLGIFDKVDVLMDAVPGASGETDVTVTVKEKNWYSIKVGTTTSMHPRGGLRLEATGTLRNVTGNGELLDVGMLKAGGENHTLLARLVKPRIMGADTSLHLEGKVDTTDLYSRCSFAELVRSVTATARTFDGVHALSAELAWRDVMPRRHPLVPYAHNASLSILAEARPSSKGSVRYTYTDEGRDDPHTPSRGGYLRTSVEAAGPPLGDVAFAKGEVEAQRHIPLAAVAVPGVDLQPIALSLCASAAAIRPILGCKRTCINDRFFLGGPLSLRGFQFYGVGPRAPREQGGCEGGDSLGGDIKYTASASLGSPFPLAALATAGWRFHVFANAGNLTTWDTPLRRLPRDTRLSVGAGVAWNIMGAGRLELNYARVLRKSPDDVTRPFQLGLGINFY